MSKFKELLLEQRIREAAKTNDVLLSEEEIKGDNFEEILKERTEKRRQARIEMGLPVTDYNED